MKQVFTIIAIVILFTISGLIFWAGLAPQSFFDFWKVYPAVTNKIVGPTKSEAVLSSNGQITINGSTWQVEVALDEAQKEAGLSNRKTLFNKKGMLFVFNTMANQSFWMKDMLIPLDMVFFDNNWKVVLIERNVDSGTFPKIFGNSVKSKYVLEINAGEADSFGIKVGSIAIFVNK